MSYNRLSGNIPPELGSLADLKYYLNLSYNQLSGDIPPELAALSIQPWLYLTLRYNALTASGPVLLAFLNGKEPDWAQTVPPTDVQATAAPNDVELSWTPILYQDTGYYEVSYATTPGGPYIVHRLTAVKLAGSYLADNLAPETTYYFVVRTFAAAPWLPDGLWSDNSAEVSATTPGNTPIGSNLLVQVGGGMAVIFGEVTVAGNTTASASAVPPEGAPTGFQALGMYYDIVTTASYDHGQGLDVTLPYDDTLLTLEQEQAIVLLHYEGAQWVDCTFARDIDLDTVTWHVPGPSWFAVAISTNRPPELGAISAPLDPILVDALVNASAGFSDPDAGDTHTAFWNWGDGTTSAGVVDEAIGEVTGSHAYSLPGVYTLQLVLADGGGESATAAYQYVVIYDPDGGFVTGGGWIMSPAGAYVPNPALSGKATFGFVAKYKPGANTPTGNTEFQFHAAGLNFKSTSYDWLVVAGARAQYKGLGTINGAGEYSFMLTVIDGQVNGGGGVDKFRIKIMDKDSGGLVYDNRMNAPDDADPTTALGGGSIVIHK